MGNGVKHIIHKETKKITESLNLSKKVECYIRHPAFIIIKDHKPNFWNNTKCRRINPTKNKLELVIKRHLQKSSRLLLTPSNTTTVIERSKSLPQKDKWRFIKYDIVEFYPSILEELFNHSIPFARSITAISNPVIDIINYLRKSPLFDKASNG